MKHGKRDTACESGSNHDSADEDEVPVSSSDKMFQHAKYVLRFIFNKIFFFIFYIVESL